MIIQCQTNADLKGEIERFAEDLKTKAHLVGGHGLTEKEFYESPLFRGAIERIRGQFSASMGEKRTFVQHVLNFLQDRDLINDWDSAGSANRHDYLVRLKSGKNCAIELKGCLDGNNTNIFERPPHADEFVLWSVCTNSSADPRKNVWSGIHTRLGPEIVSKSLQVDGLIVWDMVCATLGRPCPKLTNGNKSLTEIGPYKLPPPCIYLFPRTSPSPRNNPNPAPHKIGEVEFLDALAKAFDILESELYEVRFEVRFNHPNVERKTRVSQADQLLIESPWGSLKRS